MCLTATDSFYCSTAPRRPLHFEVSSLLNPRPRGLGQPFFLPTLSPLCTALHTGTAAPMQVLQGSRQDGRQLGAWRCGIRGW